MASRLSNILPLILTLFWIVAINHCVLEGCFSHLAEHTQHNETDDDCKSHQGPCPVSAIVTKKSLTDSESASEFFVSLTINLFQTMTEEAVILREQRAFCENFTMAFGQDLLYSLKLAPNAPPILSL